MPIQYTLVLTHIWENCENCAIINIASIYYCIIVLGFLHISLYSAAAILNTMLNSKSYHTTYSNKTCSYSFDSMQSKFSHD